MKKGDFVRCLKLMPDVVCLTEGGLYEVEAALGDECPVYYENIECKNAFSLCNDFGEFIHCACLYSGYAIFEVVNESN